MGIDDIELNAEEVGSRLHASFQTARASDEFEFACTLMRVRGMEDVGWDPFVETQQLVTDLMTLINAPLVAYTKVRLGLLLYSHLTEVGSVYEILANLTRVVAGERYAMDPFLDHYPRNRKGEPQFLSTAGKVRALKEMLDAAGQPAVVESLDWFFNASVRKRLRARRLHAARGVVPSPLRVVRGRGHTDTRDTANPPRRPRQPRLGVLWRVHARVRRAACRLPGQQSGRGPNRRGL